MRSTSIDLEHLIALSDEMAALVRAGVPLERGLVNFGEDVPGELGRLAKRLGQRLERGDSLEEVLATDEAAFPRVYRTVVEAGMRSGRLASALEGLASAARRLAELRRAISLSMLYPLTVILLAYGLLIFFIVQLAPRYQAAYQDLRLKPNPLLDGLASLGNSAHLWGPALPVLLLLAVVTWWWQSGRSLLVESSAASLLLGWIPGVRKLLAESRIALFSELLALLVEHDTPLPEAIRLAASVAGDRRTAHSAEQLAAAVTRGEAVSLQLDGCPPILAWLLTTGPGQELSAQAARQTAEHYGASARYRAEMVRSALPVLATLCVAGVVTLCYGLMLLVPWFQMLEQLG